MASIENLRSTVRQFGGDKDTKPTLPIDCNPYEQRSHVQQLKNEYAKQIARIGKLPYAERREARRELDERYALELAKLEKDV